MPRKKALDCDGAEAQVAIVPAREFIRPGPHETPETMPSDSTSRMFAPFPAEMD